MKEISLFSFSLHRQSRSILLSIVLALMLLLVQQSGVTHAVSHWSDSHQNSSGKQLPSDKVCEECLAFAQIGSALASKFVPFIAESINPVFAIILLRVFLPQTFTPFHSRAPPLSL